MSKVEKACRLALVEWNYNYRMLDYCSDWDVDEQVCPDPHNTRIMIYGMLLRRFQVLLRPFLLLLRLKNQ